MKSRKATLALIQPVIHTLKGDIKVDNWGDISISVNDCRVIIFTRGSRRSPSSIQCFSTVRCPEADCVTRALQLAKKVAVTLNFPVTFSAAGRMISATVKP